MIKTLALLCLAFIISQDIIAQTSCNIELQLDSGISINSKIPFTRFSILGTSKKVANELAHTITVQKNDLICINSDTLCKSFQSIFVNKKFKLTRIEIYNTCVGEELSYFFRFVYCKE